MQIIKRASSNAFNLLIALVFIIGAVVAVLGFWKQGTVQAHGIRVTYHQFFTAPDGKRSLDASIERVQVGRDWKELQTYFDDNGHVHRINRIYAVDERGMVKIDEVKKQLKFLGPHHAEHKHPFSETITRADPNFIGEDNILGYKTLVLRFNDAGGGYTEEHFAPALDGVALKRVFNSGNYSTTIEAIKVEMGAPSVGEMIAEIPPYPVFKKERK